MTVEVVECLRPRESHFLARLSSVMGRTVLGLGCIAAVAVAVADDAVAVVG